MHASSLPPSLPPSLPLQIGLGVYWVHIRRVHNLVYVVLEIQYTNDFFTCNDPARLHGSTDEIREMYPE